MSITRFHNSFNIYNLSSYRNRSQIVNIYTFNCLVDEIRVQSDIENGHIVHVSLIETLALYAVVITSFNNSKLFMKQNNAVVIAVKSSSLPNCF